MKNKPSMKGPSYSRNTAFQVAGSSLRFFISPATLIGWLLSHTLPSWQGTNQNWLAYFSTAERSSEPAIEPPRVASMPARAEGRRQVGRIPGRVFDPGARYRTMHLQPRRTWGGEPLPTLPI